MAGGGDYVDPGRSRNFREKGGVAPDIIGGQIDDGAGPGGAYDITTRIWGEEPDLQATGHMTEMLSYLRFLRGTGEVTRTTEADGTYRYRNGGSTWA